MGYISIQINKAKGSADTGASDHIERKTIPKNADPTRTHLNRELVEFPDGVSDRTEAISHRIRTAGIKRKITPDQVRAIRIVLSGTHEDMMKIQDEGRLDEWCDDNLQWLHYTFGKENTVSAVLHMDEHTPHIHATVVPIVTGERRKAKKKQTEGKRSYRKKANTVRLCADDVLTREKLVTYHDSYAKAMEKYGLQRGVRGSEARHTTTAQYYRDLKRQTDELEANVQQLQTEQQQAEQQLDEVRQEVKSEKLEAAKTEAKAAFVAKVGSLLGGGKLKELEADNRTLQGEVAARDERASSCCNSRCSGSRKNTTGS
jgi:plasmid recombination enzyme